MQTRRRCCGCGAPIERFWKAGHALAHWSDDWLDRARIVLGAADGLSSRPIADMYDLPRATVLLWKCRYETDQALDRPRPAVEEGPGRNHDHDP
jgi:hypothetical protein